MSRAQSLFVVFVAFTLGTGAFLVAPTAFGDAADGSAHKVVGWHFANADEEHRWEAVERDVVKPEISVSDLLTASTRPLQAAR